MKKLISSKMAARLIKDKSTVGIGGFGAYGAPETLLQALADEYEENHHPVGLTVTCGVSPGDNTRENVGLNRIAKAGLLDAIIAGHQNLLLGQHEKANPAPAEEAGAAGQETNETKAS